MTWKK